MKLSNAEMQEIDTILEKILQHQRGTFHEKFLPARQCKHL